MQCPKCQSENTQRLQVIYDAGTHQISTTSTSFMAGAGTAGGAGGTASTSTSGTSQTHQAAKAAPPPKQSMQLGGWMIAIGVFAQMTDNYKLIGLGLLIGGVFLIGRARKYNATEWVALRNRWENSWMCNKCGNMYTLSA
jgi:hypothetical protein